MTEPAKRLPDGTKASDVIFHGLGGPGIRYWKDADHKCWMIHFPEPKDSLGTGVTGNLAAHTVTEHEDGTITVSPSILVSGQDGERRFERHGYLERGIWRDV